MTGEELKRLRLAAGLTRERLARAVGVVASTIFGWETGRHRIPGPAALALRTLLVQAEAEQAEAVR